MQLAADRFETDDLMIDGDAQVEVVDYWGPGDPEPNLWVRAWVRLDTDAALAIYNAAQTR